MMVMDELVLERKLLSGTIQKLASGILVYRPEMSHGANPTIEHLRIEYETFMEIQQGQKSPLLVYTADLLTMDAKAKEFVSTTAKDFASKISIVAGNSIPAFVFNMIIYLSRPEMPAKVFKNETEAWEWIRK